MNFDWSDQYGGILAEQGLGAAIDDFGNIYILGNDTSLRKYDLAGNLLWAKTTSRSRNWAIATDSSGAIFLSGADPSGNAHISKYSSAGDVIWDRELVGNRIRQQVGVAVGSAGEVFISGHNPRDRFVAKYSPSGDLLWNKEFGSGLADQGWGVAADLQGNVFVSGLTDGSLASQNVGRGDIFVRKYNGDGEVLWTYQDGTSFDDSPQGASADAFGNFYITGYTQNGSLDGGVAQGYDAFTRKIDPDGNILWTRQLRSAGQDYGVGIAASPSGLVHIVGITDGVLEGTASGGRDAYHAFYDSDGVLLSVEQFETSGIDRLGDVAVNASGDVVMTGRTTETRSDFVFDFSDVVVIKGRVVPEPTSIALGSLGLLTLAYFRKLAVKG